MSETWEVSADLNMQDYWRDAIGGSWTPVKYSKHVSWHPTTIKAEINAHRTEPVSDCLVGLVFSLAVVSNREDMAWSAVKAKDAEITSLRAQLDEARAAFTQIREHTKNVVDDDLISVIDMIAEDFLDPSKRAPLRALLSESKS